MFGPIKLPIPAARVRIPPAAPLNLLSNRNNSRRASRIMLDREKLQSELGERLLEINGGSRNRETRRDWMSCSMVEQGYRPGSCAVETPEGSKKACEASALSKRMQPLLPQVSLSTRPIEVRTPYETQWLLSGNFLL